MDLDSLQSNTPSDHNQNVNALWESYPFVKNELLPILFQKSFALVFQKYFFKEAYFIMKAFLILFLHEVHGLFVLKDGN